MQNYKKMAGVQSVGIVGFGKALWLCIKLCYSMNTFAAGAMRYVVVEALLP